MTGAGMTRAGMTKREWENEKALSADRSSEDNVGLESYDKGASPVMERGRCHKNPRR